MKMMLILVLILHTINLSTAAPPNIILILADDLGYNDIGYHNPAILTPVLDRLAKEGVILEQNYVQPICTPTRAALLTGMYPYLTGRQGYPISHKMPTGLTLDRKLVGEYLQDRGYATHMVGKWHLGFCKEEYLPTNRGFDTHYGFWTGKEDYFTKIDRHGYDFRDGIELDFTANMTYATELFTRRTTQLIRDHAALSPDKPFFLYMSHQATHAPLAPPQQYQDLYPNITDEARMLFSATASAMDESVGILVDDLKENGMYENSLIIFLGDNGGLPILGAGGNNWPLRGIKGSIWEGGVRTPGFVHSPLLNTTGVSVNQLFHVTDWMPTLYHVAGASEQEIAAQNFSGINQWSLFTNPLTSENLRSEIVINLDDDKGTTFGALRQGDYKYVKNPGPWLGWIPPPGQNGNECSSQFGAKTGENEGKLVDIIHLYNIAEDPEERNDISGELPHIVDVMDSRMEELKLAMVPADDPAEVEGGNQGGIWGTGWC